MHLHDIFTSQRVKWASRVSLAPLTSVVRAAAALLLAVRLQQ